MASQDQPAFDTRDLESALDDVFADPSARRPDWSAHAATAAFGAGPASSATFGTSSRGTAHRTARRLDASEIRGELFAGPEHVRSFFALADLLTVGLGSGLIRPDGSPGSASTSRSFPDRVQESVRHVCLVLGVHPAAALVPSADDSYSFAIASLAPPVLGVPMALREPLSTETLRARAAVGVARTFAPFSLLALLDSADAPGLAVDVLLHRGPDWAGNFHFQALRRHIDAGRCQLRWVSSIQPGYCRMRRSCSSSSFSSSKSALLMSGMPEKKKLTSAGSCEKRSTRVWISGISGFR